MASLEAGARRDLMSQLSGRLKAARSAAATAAATARRAAKWGKGRPTAERKAVLVEMQAGRERAAELLEALCASY